MHFARNRTPKVGLTDRLSHGPSHGSVRGRVGCECVDVGHGIQSLVTPKLWNFKKKQSGGAV